MISSVFRGMVELCCGIGIALFSLSVLLFRRGQLPAVMRMRRIVNAVAGLCFAGIIGLDGADALIARRHGAPLASSSGEDWLVFGLAILLAVSISTLIMVDCKAVRSVHQTMETVRDLQVRAESDAMTGLLNHDAFFLSGEEHRQEAGHASFAVILVDLDRFKAYNDTHGHLAGDELIRCAAELLRSAARQRDLIGRYGGDEFALAVSTIPLDAALAMAQRMRETIRKRCEGVTASIGIAWGPASGMRFDAFVAEADRALYRAKAGGGDCVEWVKLPSGGSSRN